MQKTIGNQWAKVRAIYLRILPKEQTAQWRLISNLTPFQITKALPGRTDNAIKNRFHATCRAQSRKEPGDYEKSSYHYNDGNTDSDSNSANGSETSGRMRTDIASGGSSIAMMQAHCPILAYPSPDCFQNGSLFVFSNSVVPYMFDSSISSADLIRNIMPAQSGSTMKSSKTHKCAKKSKKMNSNSQIRTHHFSQEATLMSAGWAQPINSTQDLLSDLTHSNLISMQSQQRNHHAAQQPTATVISPSSSRVSTCPSPTFAMPLPLSSSIGKALLRLSSSTDLSYVSQTYNRTPFNGLSVKDRLAPTSTMPLSPTFSEDFRMNIPSASSIDLDENIFDDWMDDGIVIETQVGRTNDIDVPFYRSSFDWGVTGCCSIAATNAASGCFSTGQSNAMEQPEINDVFCGFQRLSYQPSAAPSSGFFSSLGGRICGSQKMDPSFESGHQQMSICQPQPVYATNVELDHVKTEYSNNNLSPAHLLQGQYSHWPLVRKLRYQ